MTTAIAALITAVTGLVAAIGGIIAATKNHASNDARITELEKKP
jgi:hypothetical protein